MELLAPNAVPNTFIHGQVVSDGQPVSMASGPTQVLVASAGDLWCFQLVAGTTTTGTGAILGRNSFTQIPQFNGITGYGLLAPSVSQVVYGDGFFFVLFSNSNQIQASNPVDGSSFQGLSETQVSVFSDNISAIFMDHRILWVFGPNNIQPYWDSGNFPFPYDVYQGGFIEQGICAPFSVAKADNSIFWLGQDARGAGIVWRANGFTPQRVSTHAIEYELSTYLTISDAVCFAYQDQGHTFYQMNFPTAQKTWVYDCATQMWHRRAFWNAQAGVFTQSRAGFHTYNFGMHIVGDPTNGVVYEQSINYLTDFGQPIIRERTAPHLSNEDQLEFYTSLQVDVETGLGPVSPFQGSAPSTTFPMLDAVGALRTLAIGHGGILQAPLTPTVDATAVRQLFLTDSTGTTSWQITLNNIGIIQPVSVPFDPTYPKFIPFVTTLGDEQWELQAVGLPGLSGYGVGGYGAGGYGAGGITSVILTTSLISIVGRGPIMTLQWSDDAGHTWSNPYDKDCGQAGAYKTRVIWRRLGSARDRVFRIRMSDPIPWRIVDAYLFTKRDPTPSTRYATEYRKRA
jgi:hypothetical protein